MEFRNPSWISKHTREVLKFLAEHRLIYVAVDCPWQPLIPAATADRAVFRFHGRNLRGWEAQMRGQQPSVAEKYDTLYRPEELEALVRTVRELEGEAEEICIKFNNNNRDYPVRNALTFRRLLGQTPSDPEALRAEYVPAGRRGARPRQGVSSPREPGHARSN